MQNAANFLLCIIASSSRRKFSTPIFIHDTLKYEVLSRWQTNYRGGKQAQSYQKSAILLAGPKTALICVGGKKMGKMYGYARVSTKEQSEDRQVTAICEAGVAMNNVCVEKKIR